MIKRRLLLCAALAGILTNLAPTPTYAFLSDREDFGTLLGAIGGGFIGNEIGQGDGRVMATAVGAVGGALLGRNIGGTLDKTEYTHARGGYNDRYDRGWRGHNRHRGHYSSYSYYESRPVLYSAPPQVVYVAPTYEQRIGRYNQPQPFCREYVNAVTVGNRVQEGYGTACLQPDGSWQVR